MQILVDLKYLGEVRNSSEILAQEKLIKNAMNMFADSKKMSVDDLELLLLGIDNIYDKNRGFRRVKLDKTRYIDVSL